MSQRAQRSGYIYSVQFDLCFVLQSVPKQEAIHYTCEVLKVTRRPQATNIQQAKMPTVQGYVLYPNDEDDWFDLGYYLKTHMPLVEKLWTPMGLKGWEVTNIVR